MSTAYSALRLRCGLSQTEAAAFHRVGFDTVKSWCKPSGNRAGAGVTAELRTLYATIERAAAEALAAIETTPPGSDVELGVAADDREAQTLGWPCVGAQVAMLGLVIARSSRPIRIVLRGTTSATAAAADVHQR